MLPILTLFTLPADMVTSTLAYIGDVFTDAKLLIYMALGLPLAFWTIKKIMGLFRGTKA